MSNQLSLMQSYTWFGHFNYAKGSDWFPGRLRYSPESGVQLDYFMTLNFDVPSTTVLFGVLDDGKLCTLYGNFDPSAGGMQIGGASLWKGTRGFNFCLIGEHILEEHSFVGLDLDFNNLQEFCFPKSMHEQIPYSDKPLLDTDCGEVRVQVVNHGQFDFTSAGLVSELYSDNKALLADLESAIGEAIGKHPDSALFKRKTIGWYLRLLREEGATARRWMEHLYSIELLLSLLLFKPVFPIEMQLRAQDEEGKIRSYGVLGGIAGLNNQTIPKLTRNDIHETLAIRLQTIDLGAVIKCWPEVKEGFELFASKIKGDSGTRSKHQCQAEYVLLLAQLESVAQKAGLDHNKRYEEAIAAFGAAALVALILKILDVAAIAKVGQVLSRLRSEIAHFSKSRKRLDKIGLRHLVALNRCLDLVIAASLYKELGIADAVIAEFQVQHVQSLNHYLAPVPLFNIVRKKHQEPDAGQAEEDSGA